MGKHQDMTKSSKPSKVMRKYNFDHHFTLEEANALLPKLTTLLLQIQENLETLRIQQEKALNALRIASTNGEPHEQAEPDALETIRGLAAKIEEYGCIIKDYGTGLIDFPYLLDGKEVFLCWKLGEPEIQAWHELDAGYAGREPLPTPQARPKRKKS